MQRSWFRGQVRGQRDGWRSRGSWRRMSSSDPLLRTRPRATRVDALAGGGGIYTAPHAPAPRRDRRHRRGGARGPGAGHRGVAVRFACRRPGARRGHRSPDRVGADDAGGARRPSAGVRRPLVPPAGRAAHRYRRRRRSQRSQSPARRVGAATRCFCCGHEITGSGPVVARAVGGPPATPPFSTMR